MLNNKPSRERERNEDTEKWKKVQGRVKQCLRNPLLPFNLFYIPMMCNTAHTAFTLADLQAVGFTSRKFNDKFSLPHMEAVYRVFLRANHAAHHNICHRFVFVSRGIK
jgi:hypothetical protein